MSENQTDTAQPEPDTVSIRVEFPDLDSHQVARVQALRAAREVIKAQPGLFSAGVAPDAMDLINIAGWILTGADPWPDIRAHQPAANPDDDEDDGLGPRTPVTRPACLLGCTQPTGHVGVCTVRADA